MFCLTPSGTWKVVLPLVPNLFLPVGLRQHFFSNPYSQDPMQLSHPCCIIHTLTEDSQTSPIHTPSCWLQKQERGNSLSLCFTFSFARELTKVIFGFPEQIRELACDNQEPGYGDATLQCLVTSVMSDSLRLHGLQPAKLLGPWEFSRQEYWSGLPCPSPGDLPNPGIQPSSPALQADSLLFEPPRKPATLLVLFKINSEITNLKQYLRYRVKSLKEEDKNLIPFIFQVLFLRKSSNLQFWTLKPQLSFWRNLGKKGTMFSAIISITKPIGKDLHVIQSCVIGSQLKKLER